MREAPLDAGSASSEPTSGAVEGVGARLRQARVAAGISVEEAAAQLRLSPRQVNALEGEQFEHLPGRTFVRGFVKNYARLLNLDPEPLLAVAGRDLDTPVLQPTTEGMGVIPTDHAGPAAWQKWAILAILITAILAGAGYEWWQRQASLSLAALDRNQSATKPDRISAKAKELPTPPASSGLPFGEAPNKPAAEISPPQSPPPIMPKGAAIEAMVNKPAPAGVRPAVRPAPEKLPAAAGKIGLQFSETSWVEIRERGGKSLLSQHYSAGQNALVSGEPPFEIIIGNAAATRLSYDGKAIDLAAHARQNVARITLP